MNAHRTLATELGMALVVANLAAWGLWFLARAPFTQTECALLQAKRSGHDQAAASGEAFPAAYTDSTHLLFSRPLRPLSQEPVPLKILYVANAAPLVGAWSFLVPAQSNALGPTCSESTTCGILFLLLATAQWGLLGGAVGYRIMSRRI